MEGQNNGKKGRPCRYLTIEMFEAFLKNDWKHLQKEVAESKWLGRIVISALIVWALIDRLLS